MNQLDLARQIATKAHTGQSRNDGVTPYISHSQKVVSLLYGIDAKVIGWLHDVLEDTPLTEQDLLDEGIQATYVSAVSLLTKEKGQVYSSYIEELKDCEHPIIIRVKIADIVANLTDKPSANQIIKYTEALTSLSEGGNI